MLVSWRVPLPKTSLNFGIAPTTAELGLLSKRPDLNHKNPCWIKTTSQFAMLLLLLSESQKLENSNKSKLSTISVKTYHTYLPTSVLEISKEPIFFNCFSCLSLGKPSLSNCAKVSTTSSWMVPGCFGDGEKQLGEDITKTPKKTPWKLRMEQKGWRLWVITSWWLNQSIWKILVKLGNLPQVGVKRINLWNRHPGHWLTH